VKPRRTPNDLRSYRWFGRDDMRSFGHRSRAKQAGFTAEDLSGKPVIAILNTWSDANPCHTHFRLRAEDVKRGVWQAGGFPMEIPLLTLGETFMKPSTMLYRTCSRWTPKKPYAPTLLTASSCSAAATRRFPRC
jgi:dihydroxy-acid dehydratase